MPTSSGHFINLNSDSDKELCTHRKYAFLKDHKFISIMVEINCKTWGNMEDICILNFNQRIAFGNKYIF